jgi:HlyD family secretion protein
MSDDTRPKTSTSGPPGGQGLGEGIDRKVEKRWWTAKNVGIAAFALLFIGLVTYGYMSLSEGQTLNVAAEKLAIATVQEGPFQEFIAQTGSVLPRRTVYLDAVEGGRVEEIYAQEGDRVAEGDPLLRLSNSDLQMRLLTAEAQRIEQTSRLEETRFRMQQNDLDLRKQLAQIDYEIRRLEREHARNEPLHEKGLIAAEAYEQTRDELEYQRQRKELIQQAYRQDSLRMERQMEQLRSRTEQLEERYQMTQELMEHLTVRAPVAGQLTALDAEIGEIRGAGTRFGQIDMTGDFKLRAQIDEFYIERVRRGQTATTETIGGQEYELEVTKVYPEVQEGRFQVDLAFTGPMPEALRRGQTIRFRLQLGEPQQAVLLPRGGFYQQTGGNWVFVVSENGAEATRRYIELGRQNPNYYEVLSGLEPGERVVTSSYETFGTADRLALQ